MQKRIFILCTKHDENLLSLYQEAYYLGYSVIPCYLSTEYEKILAQLFSIVTVNDFVIILHTNFGSNYCHNIIKNIKCKRLLNSKAFELENIGQKLFQQTVVALKDPSISIPTYTKNNIHNNISLPCISKPNDASCGQGVKLALSLEDVEKSTDGTIFQRFIKNDGDWRVVVIGGKAVSAIKRLGRIGKVTNNLATGSFAVTEHDPIILSSIYRVAEIAADALGFDYVGIDVIKDLENNQYYFLESNERPTFETSQILTGTNIAKKIIEELVRES